MSSRQGADSKFRLSRRSFILGSGVAAAGLALYAGEIERHALDTVETTVRIRRLPSSFHGFRIAQISDIHLDEFTEPLFLSHVVNRLNKLNPDIVLITGDFITRGSLTFVSSNHAAHRCAEILSTLKTPQVFAILGNHDVAVSAALVVSALKSVKIPVLVNQYVAIEHGNSRLWLGGTDDANGGHPDLNLAIPEAPDSPVILMAHEPDYADSVIAHPRGKLVDLMLSGHSHGGQVRVPFYGPLILPPQGQKYVEGHFRFDQMQLYVNRGIGAVGLPFRFNCPPEITIHTLLEA
jgi:predicted MPP superfamily phosphohydrolase